VTAQHHHTISTTRETELADLRERLAAAHSQIVGAAASAEQYDDLAAGLRTIRRLLDEAQPDAAEIRTRWQSLLDTTDVLGESGAAAAITALVRDLVGPDGLRPG
jgi:hypothetical protein